MLKLRNPVNVSEEIKNIFEDLKRSEKLAKYVDASLQIPQPFIGAGPIKLIVLGQDPTVKNEASRKSIKTVLNLDTNGSVRAYLSGVCSKLGIDLKQHLYATNLFKNFFVQPPTQIKEIDIFQTLLPIWLPLLKEELAQYPDVPVITLGEPVLQTILKPGMPERLREYWGYTVQWKTGQIQPLQYLKPEDNLLGRNIFPFPHQPSLRKQFYKEQMYEYITFMKTMVPAGHPIGAD